MPCGQTCVIAQKDQRGDRKAAALKEFDKDGDGRLNEQERTAAKAAIAKRSSYYDKYE